jgi:hypothetical protein
MPPKGTTMSPEQRAKISSAMSGRTKTDEHRAAISESVQAHHERRRRHRLSLRVQLDEQKRTKLILGWHPR